MPVFTSATASAAARKSHAENSRRFSRDGLQQAVVLRKMAFDAAVSMRGSFSPEKKITRDDAIGLGNLIRAWEASDEQIRIYKNRPLPGSRRPAPEQPPPPKRRPFRNLPPNASLPHSGPGKSPPGVT